MKPLNPLETEFPPQTSHQAPNCVLTNAAVDTEALLHAWTPRPPSPGLERRLFGRPRSGSPRQVSWVWLSPVTACLLLGGLLLIQRLPPPVLVDAGHAPLVAMILSNQSYAPYLPGSFQRNQNRWDTFEWTKGSPFPSSSGPFLRSE